MPNANVKVVRLCEVEGVLVMQDLAMELWASYAAEYRQLGCHSPGDVATTLARSDEVKRLEEVFVAVAEQKLLGSVTIQYRSSAGLHGVAASTLIARTAWLDHLLIVGDCQYKHGVKTILMQTALVRVREMGLRELYMMAQGEPACQLGSKPTCAHGHDLHGSETNTGWACGLRSVFGNCKGSITGFHQTGSRLRWRCDECDYDICSDCLTFKMENAEADLFARLGFERVPVDERMGRQGRLWRWTAEDHVTRIRVESIERHATELAKEALQHLMTDTRHLYDLRAGGLDDEKRLVDWLMKAKVTYIALTPEPRDPTAFAKRCWANLRGLPLPPPPRGNLAGIMAIHPEVPPLDKPTDVRNVGPWIRYLYVVPEYHGRGVDRMLLRAAIDWAEGSGVPELWSLASEDQHLESVEVREFTDEGQTWWRKVCEAARTAWKGC